jgi:hypothetical protein
MKFKLNTQVLTPSNASPALTSASTVSAVIQMQKLRLEGFWVDFKYTNHGTAPADGGPDGAAGFIKEIRLRVNDRAGARNAVKITGPGVLSFVQNNVGYLGRASSFSYGNDVHLVAGATYQVMIYVPIRPLWMEEPFGNLMSIPMDNTQLNENAVIEVDIRSASEVQQTNLSTASTIKITAVLRDVAPNVPYITSELVSDKFKPTTTSGARFELPQAGFLTQLLIQGYSSDTYATTVTRADTLSSGGFLSFEYGRNVERKYYRELLQETNDLTRFANPGASGSDLAKRVFTDEYFVDFITDTPQGNAFSVESLPNLNADALGGDRAAIVFADYANAAYQAVITRHSILAKSLGELKQLLVAI